MKKRILSVALALVLSVACCSCADGPTASEASVTSSSSGSSVSVSETTVVEKPSSVSAEPQTETPVRLEERDYGVLYEPSTKSVVLVDEASPVKQFNLSWMRDSICGIYWPYVVTLAKEYTSNGDNACYVSAYDMETDEIFGLYSGYNVKSVDVYEGICYVLIYEEETCKYTELAFDMETRESVTSPCREMYDIISNYSVVAGSLQRFDCDAPCLKEMMDRAGYAILYLSDGRYGIFDGKQCREISFEDRIYDVEDYSKDVILYTAWDENYRYKQLFARYNEGPEYLVTNTLDEYLGYLDGIVYYSTMNDEGFGLLSYNVWAFDPKKGTSEPVYSFGQNPGMSRAIKPGISGFTIYDGDFYYVADDGVETEWYRTFINVSDARETEKLGAGVLSYDFLKFGTVSFNSNVIYCEDCGVPVSSYYGEVFVVGDSVSEYADKINDCLYMDDISSLMSFESSADEYKEWTCREHERSIGCHTQMSYLTGVHLRGDKYITMDFEGYWYGGGAHGEVFTNHYLFDIETGERIYMKDLFDGPEEAFRDIIARYTQVDYETYAPGMSPYYAENADAVYEQAFEYADPEELNFRFAENGAVVEYAPYMMGPYASGMISFEIPYSEFGLEGILN